VLKRRAKAVVDADLDKIIEAEKKLLRVIQSQLDELKRPVMAYITFTNNYGVDLLSFQSERLREKASGFSPFKILN
jgi:hypothetical protein